ncbi:hypothetical protein [Stenotrophomonas tumulicola]|uniref:Lipoprotein n=1 Tax=Stenotrophomonas tumulicola TaxID=1685415 RepID=A0A7W3FQC6_9GAMM|nr:hypothetical protein [Stenotrophomonas tumulicola]MBA8683748.1 hypothetical protein [Stenotrophomonas tumulicola]
MAYTTIKAATVIAATLAFAGCSSELDKVRDQFIDSCSSGGGDKAICECAIDKLQAHYGEEGLVRIQTDGYPPPDFIDQLFNAAQECRKGKRK